MDLLDTACGFHTKITRLTTSQEDGHWAALIWGDTCGTMQTPLLLMDIFIFIKQSTLQQTMLTIEFRELLLSTNVALASDYQIIQTQTGKSCVRGIERQISQQ